MANGSTVSSSLSSKTHLNGSNFLMEPEERDPKDDSINTHVPYFPTGHGPVGFHGVARLERSWELYGNTVQLKAKRQSGEAVDG